MQRRSGWLAAHNGIEWRAAWPKGFAQLLADRRRFSQGAGGRRRRCLSAASDVAAASTRSVSGAARSPRTTRMGQPRAAGLFSPLVVMSERHERVAQRLAVQRIDRLDGVAGDFDEQALRPMSTATPRTLASMTGSPNPSSRRKHEQAAEGYARAGRSANGT